MGASYLMGTVVIPLILGQTEPLLVPGGPMLAGLVFPLDTASWLSNIVVAREAGTLPVAGLGVGWEGMQFQVGWWSLVAVKPGTTQDPLAVTLPETDQRIRAGGGEVRDHQGGGGSGYRGVY